MQIAYGSKRFTANTTGISLREELIRNAADQVIEIRRMAAVQGQLLSSSATATSAQSDLTTQLSQFRSSMLVPQQDLVFYQDSGAEAFAFRNTQSISGVKILDFSAMEQPEDGAEFATVLSFSFRVESVEPVSGSDTLLVDYQESARFGGGHPMIYCALGINGVNQEQLIYPKTAFFCEVNGQAKGYKTYPKRPIKPGPLWSAEYTISSPERHGRGYTAYTIGWSFRRESIEPVEFLPRRWIGA